MCTAVYAVLAMAPRSSKHTYRRARMTHIVAAGYATGYAAPPPAALLPPDAGSARNDLENALHDMFKTDQSFINKYRVLGGEEQRAGGQGLVQFAEQVGSRQRFAIKVRALGAAPFRIWHL